MGGQSSIDMEEYAAAAPKEKKDDISVGNIEKLVETALLNNPALSGFKVEVKGHEVDDDGHVLVNCVVSTPPRATEIDVVIDRGEEAKKEEA